MGSGVGSTVWMPKNAPVDSRVRLVIAQWPPDAPRGSVTTFCVEHGISRKTFYAIRARALAEGQAAALEPRSRRPHTSPAKISDGVKQQAVRVRAALESSGLDHGPISVHDKMLAVGMTPVPSVASLARIFREMGIARVEPRKKPRSAWRRFVYPAPNACWQLDATEYVLAGGRKCVVFQLEDDHSRLAVASHVATGETSEAAIVVFDKGVAAHGIPQRLLTDNGVALNPARRGIIGQLTAHATALGVEAITGKPYKPTTQGKNERFHQTLFRYLDKQPLAATIDELQEHVDRFDHIYNTQRPHQGLPGRITPQTAWDATDVAEPPRPKQEDPTIRPPATARDLGSCDVVIEPWGYAYLHGIKFQIARQRAGQTVHAAWDNDGVIFADTATGEVIAQRPRPPRGTRYVGNGTRRGRPSKY